VYSWHYYRVFTRSSKRPALALVFWIHLLGVCWTFAGSCKHPIREWADEREAYRRFQSRRRAPEIAWNCVRHVIVYDIIDDFTRPRRRHRWRHGGTAPGADPLQPLSWCTQTRTGSVYSSSLGVKARNNSPLFFHFSFIYVSFSTVYSISIPGSILNLARGFEGAL